MFVPQLNILRFLAAMAIVVFHYFDLDSIDAPKYLENLILRGNQAVTFFFFLSGYVMYLAYSNRETKFITFMKARVARIMPLYWLAFLLCLFMVLVFTEDRPKGINVVLQFFAIHAWFPGKVLEINYPSWSIAVEFAFYFIFPFVLKLNKRIKLSWFALIAIAVWLICQVVHIMMIEKDIVLDIQDMYQVVLYHPLLHIGTFLFGMVAAQIFVKIKNGSHKGLMRIFWIGGISLWSILMMTDNSVIAYGHNGLFAPIYALILIGFSLDSGRFIDFCSRKVFVEAGNISYGMYILQAFLAMVLIDQFELPFLPFLLILIAFSWVMYRYFEVPAQKWIRKL